MTACPARAACLVLGLSLLVTATAAARPQTIEVNGTTLVLSGHGTRTELFFVQLYSVALYLPRKLSDPQTIQSADLAKALRIEIRYDGSLPDRIPETWRQELLPALTWSQQRALRRHYRRLQQHDVITIRYAPSSGTTVALNHDPVLHDEGNAVMNAFLDVWIGRNPVSTELKQALL